MVWRNTFQKISFIFLIAVYFSDANAVIKLEEFKKKEIKIGKTSLVVHVADSSEKRNQGLMHIKDWKKTKGMLFIFSDEETRSFWMKDTYLELSLAFFKEDGTLFQFAELNPPKSAIQRGYDSVLSQEPAKYVLEVPRGWFEKNQIKLKQKLSFK